jgi:hypothetical protein
MPAPFAYVPNIALDSQPQTTFGGIALPVEMITVHSQGRQHVHEFPHAPGGVPEKMGRGIWWVTVDCSFQVVFAKYPTSYPTDMLALRRMYEAQTTATFVHPSYGQWPALIANWKGVWNPRLRSGEKVSLELLEDQRANFLTPPSATSQQSTTITSNQAALDAQLSAIKSQLLISQSDLNVFDTLRAASNAVASLTGFTQQYTMLIQAKSQQLRDVCSQVDTLPSMQSPLAIGIIDPLKNIWAAATSTAQATRLASLGSWVVPQTMSVQAIARVLYNGDASRATDIQTLNAAAIPNPFAVPAGTKLRYFLQNAPKGSTPS